jgi:hypothetical protein
MHAIAATPCVSAAGLLPHHLDAALMQGDITLMRN